MLVHRPSLAAALAAPPSRECCATWAARAKTPALLLVLTLSLVSPVGAVDTNDATAETLAKWVDSLGSNDFGARERAEESLSQVGLAAEAALKDGLTHKDLEVRIRAARLLSQLKRLAFERLVEKFVNGGELETPLPGWRAYAKIAGDSRDSKRLFVNMLKQGEGALQLIEDEKDISHELAVQLQTLTPQFSGVFGAGPTVPGGADNPAASLALTLMLASKLTASDYTRLSSSLYQVFRNDSPELKSNQQLNRMFRHYLEHVLSLETDRSLILYVVLEHEIKDIALQHSRRIVADTSQSSGTLDRVVTCLGRFGDKSDIPKLQALLKDERITNSWSRGQGKPLVRTQLRDRALAMLIHLVGKQPADFGFELTVPAEKVVFQPYSCGFETDEQREQVHKNWRKWWGENADRFADK